MEVLSLKIKGLENYYVSRCGKVFDKLMNEKKQSLDRYGYLYSSFTFANGVQKKIKIHRCVAFTFLENKYNKPTVNHKNGIKTDNNADNLEFATFKEQSQHSRLNKLQVSKKGKECSFSTKIFIFNKSLQVIDVCYGSREVIEKYNEKKSNVFMQLNKKHYTKELDLYFRRTKEKPKFKKPKTTGVLIKELISGATFKTVNEAQKELSISWSSINKSLKSGCKIEIKRRGCNNKIDTFHFVKI